MIIDDDGDVFYCRRSDLVELYPLFLFCVILHDPALSSDGFESLYSPEYTVA